MRQPTTRCLVRQSSMVSRSMLDQTLHPHDLGPVQGSWWGTAEGPLDQHLRVLVKHAKFPVTATKDPKDYKTYTFIVAGDLASVNVAIAEFNSTIFWSFTALFLGLVAAAMHLRIFTKTLEQNRTDCRPGNR